MWNLETMQCVALCEGHAMAVGAVVFPKRARQFFDGMAPWMVTGSKDKTIKVPPCGTALGPGRPTAPPSFVRA